MRFSIKLAFVLALSTIASAGDNTNSPKLHSHNTSQKPPTSFPFPFIIPPNTDLWYKPAPIDGPPTSLPVISTSQPTCYVPLPLTSFIRTSVQLSFIPEVQYDHAGLVLLFPRDPHKWIKGGLEYVDGMTKNSVVVTAGDGKGSDWSVSPLTSGVPNPTTGRVRTVVEFETRGRRDWDELAHQDWRRGCARSYLGVCCAW